MRPGNLLIILIFSVFTGAATAQEQGSVEALWELVERQQQQIDALEERIARYETALTDAEGSLETTETALEAAGDAIEVLQSRQAEPSATTLGGYGELHYNNLDAEDPGSDLDRIDYHRFVLFLGHEFNDRVSFFSELEVEHSLAGDGQPGEVELEQAFVRFGLNDNVAAHAGLFLVPVGILNETHEPPTFYGVERNAVENVILPSTWWEAGGGLTGTTPMGLGWDVAVHSGLRMPTLGGSAFRVRSGRQKVAEALASDLAVTGRLRYTGIPGLELSGSIQYQSDPSQVPGDGLDSGRLLTGHAVYQRGPFSLRALYARWDFEGAAVEAADDDAQTGWYVEPSFRLGGAWSRWGVYGRYEGVEGARDADEFTQSELGFNFWPVEDVVLKFSYREREHEIEALSGLDFSGVDLGLGYQF